MRRLQQLEHCKSTAKAEYAATVYAIAARPHLRSTLRGNQRQHRRACDAWWRPRSPREGLPKRLQRRALRRSSWVTPRRRSWTAARTRFWTWAPTPASRRGSCTNPSSTPGRRSYRSFRRRASTKTARCAAPSASSPRASTGRACGRSPCDLTNEGCGQRSCSGASACAQINQCVGRARASVGWRMTRRFPHRHRRRQRHRLLRGRTPDGPFP